jgi:hypothetical protein
MGCTTTSKLISIKTIKYPSASGAEYVNNRFYLMGDDATSLLVLDNKLKQVDSIPIIEYPAYRIQKDKKPDIECIAQAPNNQLWLIGSGSASLRNNYWIVDPAQKKSDRYSFQSLYESIKSKHQKDLNIEGATFLPGSLLLANRGHNGFPQNHFIKIDTSTLFNTIPAFKVASIEAPLIDGPFAGISGLCYIENEDVLFATASTEETNNSLDDGAIGKSYIWIFEHFLGKIASSVLQPSRFIDLESVDNRFKGQKIESICLEKITLNSYLFLLTADNDNGSSTLFKLQLKKD